MGKAKLPLEGFWERPLRDLLQQLQATPAGLTADEAKRRLRQYGPNSLVQKSRFAALFSVFRLFANPLVIILLVASGISIGLGDPVGGSIIIAIVLLSVLLNFFMEFQARHAVEEIRKQVATTAAVLRDGREQELPIAELVPGDIVHLHAGDLVPADARLLDVKDLQVRESALTGESLPVEKAAADLPAGKHGVADASNSVFLGTAVQTGIGTAVIVCTGRDTSLGEIAQRLATRPPETEFGRGIRHFGIMITYVTMALVLFVLLVNLILHRPVLESFLFSVALAVGMTPELMPMIITVTLAQGARRMTKKKVLVKQLSAIEDFGSIEILCSDKTGTLTKDEIVLDRHVDVQGKEDENVLRLIYLNSYFEAGIKSPLDDAILKYARPKIVGVCQGGRDSLRLQPQAPLGGRAARRRAPPHYQGRGRKYFCHLQDGDHRWLPPAVRRRPAGSSGGDLPEAEFRRLPRSRGGRAEGGEARCLQGGGRARYDAGGIRGIP